MDPFETLLRETIADLKYKNWYFYVDKDGNKLLCEYYRTRDGEQICYEAYKTENDACRAVNNMPADIQLNYIVGRVPQGIKCYFTDDTTAISE